MLCGVGSCMLTCSSFAERACITESIINNNKITSIASKSLDTKLRGASIQKG